MTHSRRQARRQNRPSTVALAAAGFLSAYSCSVAAFSPSLPSVVAAPSHRSPGSWRCRRTPSFSTSPAACTVYATTKDLDDIPTSPKLESAAVRRFTTGYDKLCKNCPTRLKPRVDTLAEMILGLSDSERDELMATVTKRAEEGAEGSAETSETKDGTRGARNAREVYDFQVEMEGASLIGTVTKKKAKSVRRNGVAVRPMNDSRQKKRIENMSTGDGKRSSADDLAVRDAKLSAKLTKSRSKLQKSQLDHSRTSRLLTVASLFLSEGGEASLPPSVAGANDCNADVDELRSMDVSELELQKLKYEATMAKCAGKMAKARVKMFASNLELSRVRALRAERMNQEGEASIGNGTTEGGANGKVATMFD
uniref:Uncharacterized protein n=1 Tax=Odontella aurita TaxID=265563 RepID=A0A7S4JPJ9_9STRA|mmetsp:Transcript_50964/g.153226  ORF Transcript_50964/g.153226 Transcript_50964/m.153226 type:complete len:367 (+) Transcript_50964:162-1262(+)|eukprot:CAMPEP_0113560228 /NCGR_PEP_ID=MMETSP0015_2-20120614/19317_1 /TAXON_ID=2838 /ORGANISM="Odontella" /LENGTH=366 /DNA_ID=CAMNT_0000461915 /DNA_START=162 /DNA_END=1262 /DNA_ORIENTATION=- /assembly_acc=CAM_ASM_000160